MKPILAVIVLYNMQLDQSASYTALSRALQDRPELAEQLDLTIFDNSARPQPLPPDCAGAYFHDQTNPGLARRYNTALTSSISSGATWLLLLDQDTQLTPAFLEEAIDLSAKVTPDIAAIIPKLVSHGRLLSPHPPSYRGLHWEYKRSTSGLITEELRAFNSGALLRVDALRHIGGFPEDYWLDYLDHAVFHRLQANGGRVWVMEASLEHEMTMLRDGNHTGAANASRHRSVLAAELRFYRQHGTPQEQRRHRQDLLRRALLAVRAGHLSEALRLLKAVLSTARGAHEF